MVFDASNHRVRTNKCRYLVYSSHENKRLYRQERQFFASFFPYDIARSEILILEGIPIVKFFFLRFIAFADGYNRGRVFYNGAQRISTYFVYFYCIILYT